MTFKSFDRDVYKSRTWQYTSKEEQFGPDEELSGVKINDKKYYFQSDGQRKPYPMILFETTDGQTLSNI
jgi:hypothetical protein